MFKSAVTISKSVVNNKPLSSAFKKHTLCVTQVRNSSVLRKRFYRTTGVVGSDKVYEVTLDQKKLKTPKGSLFQVDNHLLALAVAAEWDSQKENIRQSSMHLTSLCNTALDNPNRITKVMGAEYLVNFLSTDTVLFHSPNDDLGELQKKEWGPVISWFRERFQVEIDSTCSIQDPIVPDKTKETLLKYFLSYNLNAIHGLILSVESLKSVILTLACVERKLTVPQAVLLSRLEEEYQTGFWGRVEWSHDIDHVEVQSRVSAAILFIQLNSMTKEVKSKLVL